MVATKWEEFVAAEEPEDSHNVRKRSRQSDFFSIALLKLIHPHATLTEISLTCSLF